MDKMGELCGWMSQSRGIFVFPKKAFLMPSTAEMVLNNQTNNSLCECQSLSLQFSCFLKGLMNKVAVVSGMLAKYVFYNMDI